MSAKINLEELANNHGKRLYYFVLHRVRNHEMAQDLVQATYIQAIECEQNFLGNSKPETWLMGIALNLVRTHIYRQRRFGMAALDDVEDWGDLVQDAQQNLEKDVEKRDQIEKISLAFIKMPQEMAKTAKLVLLDNLPYQQVAEIQEIPIGTVRSRISRAREFLNQYI
jgi:RNA polymerase sigma factor (sigma-70 family)